MDEKQAEALAIAAQAAFTVLTDLGQSPGAVMLVALFPDGKIEIADGGQSLEASLGLLVGAPKEVKRYATTAMAQHRREAH